MKNLEDIDEFDQRSSSDCRGEISAYFISSFLFFSLHFICFLINLYPNLRSSETRYRRLVNPGIRAGRVYTPTINFISL